MRSSSLQTRRKRAQLGIQYWPLWFKQVDPNSLTHLVSAPGVRAALAWWCVAQCSRVLPLVCGSSSLCPCPPGGCWREPMGRQRTVLLGSCSSMCTHGMVPAAPCPHRHILTHTHTHTRSLARIDTLAYTHTRTHASCTVTRRTRTRALLPHPPTA